jgi:hypothetical protein
MATGFATPRPPKFVPAINMPQIVAIAAIPGKMVPSMGGDAPSEVCFTLVDGRPWYVPQVIADHIYAQGIQARQQIEVTGLGRKKTEVAITPVQARIPTSIQPRSAEHDYTPELTRSIAQANAARAVPPVVVTANEIHVRQELEKSEVTLNQKFLAAYMVAIDTLLETKTYAQRKGLALEIHCEDVRALAATLIIDQQKNGGAR